MFSAPPQVFTYHCQSSWNKRLRKNITSRCKCYFRWNMMQWNLNFNIFSIWKKGGLAESSKDLLCCLLKGNSMQQCIFQRLVFWGELDWPGFSELTGVHKGKCIYKYACAQLQSLSFQNQKEIGKGAKTQNKSSRTHDVVWYLHFFETPHFKTIYFLRHFVPNSMTSLQVF